MLRRGMQAYGSPALDTAPHGGEERAGDAPPARRPGLPRRRPGAYARGRARFPGEGEGAQPAASSSGFRSSIGER